MKTATNKQEEQNTGRRLEETLKHYPFNPTLHNEAVATQSTTATGGVGGIVTPNNSNVTGAFNNGQNIEGQGLGGNQVSGTPQPVHPSANSSAPLSLAVKSLDEVPEAYRGLYKQIGEGNFTLGVDLTPLTNKFNELQRTTTSKNKQPTAQQGNNTQSAEGNSVESFIKGFDDLIANIGQENRTAVTQSQEASTQQANLQKQLQSSLDRLKAEHKAQLDTANSQLNDVTEQLSKQMVGSKVLEKVLAKGVMASSEVRDFVLGAAMTKFTYNMETGEVVPKEDIGTDFNLLLGSSDPVEAWVNEFASKNPFAFQPSSGTNSGGKSKMDGNASAHTPGYTNIVPGTSVKAKMNEKGQLVVPSENRAEVQSSGEARKLQLDDKLVFEYPKT